MAASMIPFPSQLAPSSMQASIMSNTSQYSSALSNIPVTVENPGIRWAFSMGYEDLDLSLDGNAAMVEALTRVRGMGNRLHMHHMGRPETSGGLDVTTKVTNGDFVLGSTGWTESLGTGGSVSYKGIRARLVRGTVGFTAINQSLSLVVGGVYSAHIALREGTFDKLVVNMGLTAGASDIATATYTGSGRYELLFVAGATNFISIDMEGTAAAGEFVSVEDIRVSRAARSDGVDQTGTAISISDLPASTESLLNTLDFVGINGELKRLVDYVDSDASGNATLIVEPPMKLLVPDNSLIVFNRPFTKMLLDSDSFSEAISVPVLSSFQVSATEDLS